MKTIIEIKEKVPGLNGNDGLIREHFRNAIKRKTHYNYLILNQKIHKYKKSVKIKYCRYTCRLMDWDNHCAS